MDDLAALTHQLEYFFLKRIIQELRNQSITTDEAKAYSQAFLAIEPFTSFDDAYTKIEQFTKQYPLFTELPTYVNSHKKEQGDLAKISQMRAHMKQNNIDAALAVAKG